MEEVQLFIFENGLTLISEYREIISSDMGDPDIILVNPFRVDMDLGQVINLYKYPESKYTDATQMKVHRDKILTIVKPNEDLIKKYKNEVLH